MAVQSIESVTQTSASLYTQRNPAEMEKADFLKLLITQIQQQDPLNPQDPAEFTAQLTQFSSLEQLLKMNQSIQDLQVLQLSANNTLAASLLGKDIMYAGDTLTISAAGAEPVRFYAPSAAQSLTVTIKDSGGRVVRTIRQDAASSGLNTIPWDGLDENGNALAPGSYTVSVAASDASGNSLTVTPVALGRASGLIFDNGVTYLDINGRCISLSEIYSVYEP